MHVRPKEVDSKTTILVVGQHVYSGLYGGRYGIVYRIHGEQHPASVGSIGGILATGGRAEFDIVFDNGSISKMLPETILRGVQWKVFEEVATGADIAKALHFAEHEEARKATEAKLTSERRAAEREQHKKNNPHLLKYEDRPGWSDGRLAAANVRIELKKAFPGVKFKVQSEHNEVRVGWTNGPAYDAVKDICNKYKAGHFDGMTDSYENDRDATFADVFGGPDYVFYSRECTLDAVRKAWADAGNDPAQVPDDWSKGAPGLEQGIRHWIEEAWLKASF